jgi:threonine/homoserine/homoserine lactone efflux protein
MWLEALLQGIILGLGLSLAIGPVFFALLDTSITKGFREGAKFALGISLSDVFYAGLAVFGITSFLSDEKSARILAICGGVLLVLVGINSIVRKPKRRAAEWKAPERSDLRQRFSSIGKGFFLNTFNPATPVIWVGASSAGAKHLSTGGPPLQIFFISIILAVVFGTDVLKSYLSLRLSHLLTPRRLLIVNRVAGVVMVIGGIYLLFGLRDLVKLPGS